MTTTQYLSLIRRYEALIEAKSMEIARIRTMAENITVATDNERVQSSGDKDRIGKAVINIIEQSRILERIIADFYQKREEIIKQIESLDKTEEYLVLHKYYVGRETLEKIAEETGYSRSSVKRIRNNAVDHFEQKYSYLYKDILCEKYLDYRENEP